MVPGDGSKDLKLPESNQLNSMVSPEVSLRALP